MGEWSIHSEAVSVHPCLFGPAEESAHLPQELVLPVGENNRTWYNATNSGLRVLRIFSTASANRDYMISTNQLSTLNSCLSSFIGKEEKKLAIECFNVLFELLCGKIKGMSGIIQPTRSRLPILRFRLCSLGSWQGSWGRLLTIASLNKAPMRNNTS